MIYDNITGEQVDEAYHTLMKYAFNEVEKAVKSGELEKAVEDFLEVKNFCDHQIFTLEYIEKVYELIEILKKYNRDEAEELIEILKKRYYPLSP